MFRFAQADDLPRILEIYNQVWGKLPQVADMETDFEDLVILRLKQGICGN